MLPRDLVRVRRRGDALEPAFLRPTPALTDLAQRLLDHWRGGIGRTRGDLEDAAVPLLHSSRALAVAKGLQKILLDAARFTDPEGREALRARALAASAARLRAPLPTADAHRTAVAGELGLTAEALAADLYADHPDHARLEAVPDWTVERWLERYNTALAQGLLLDARSVVLHMPRDLARLRAVLRAVRFGRLVAEVRAADGGWRIAIDGPAAVLERTTAYGMQLAQLLPAVVAAGGGWRLSADLRRKDGAGTLELEAGMPLHGHAPGHHIAEELRDLPERLADKVPGCVLGPGEPVTLADGEVVAPDFALVHGGRTLQVELCTRWHAAVAKRRLDQLAKGLAPDLRLGIDRALLKLAEGRGLDQHPAFASHGFAFSGVPSPTALAGLLGG